jgi:hypothetical protein
MDLMQNKYQVTFPEVTEGKEGSWATDASARTRHGLQTRSGAGQYENYRRGDFPMPPGTNILDQQVRYMPEIPMAGSLSTGSQVTDDVTQQSVAKGFDRKSLRPTDDLYTREHEDNFYDEITVDGVTGFCERGNVLDRS